jgi:hypothetical protein
MKKYLFILLIIFGVTTKADAGNFLTLGVKAGGNFATQKNSFMGSSLDPSGITKFHAGLFSNIRIPILGLGLEADLLYSQKGSKYSYNSFDLTNRFNYIDIPIYLQWSLNLILVKPYIGVGPYFSIPMGIDVSGNDHLPEYDSNRFNNSDFGFGAIVGIAILNKVHVSLSYQLGTKNLYNGPSDINVKNRNFAVSLGYAFF